MTEDPGVSRAREALANAEDRRIAGARELLDEVRADIEPTEGHPAGKWACDPAFWVGALRHRLAGLLAYVDERAARDAAIDEAASKPLDDLMATVAEIEAERGEVRP